MNRIGQWLERAAAWLRTRAQAPNAPNAPEAPVTARFPDYVICPHCGEPEVEVWSDEAEAVCHNCGRTFNRSKSEDDQPPRDAAGSD